MAKILEERLESGLRWSYEFTSLLDTAKTEFQQVDVVDTVPFGKALIIDGLMQSADCDEFVYHELLVHPAMLCHPNPKNVFIGGGGEGSTAREVLKHKCVEKCVMVDIDGEVVDFCKRALKQNEAAFADPRLELIIDDAMARIRDSPIKFDVVIMDLDDPVEDGPCYWLYTKSFYEMVKSKMNPGGVFVTQSSAAGVKAHVQVFSPVNHTLKQVFPTVVPYSQAVYSFADEWGWNMGFCDAAMKVPTPAEVDERITNRVEGELKFLDGESFVGVCSLSKAIRKTLAAETRVLSKENPAFFTDATKGVNSSQVTAAASQL